MLRRFRTRYDRKIMRISTRAYFQYSLLAPIAIPLLLWPFVQVSGVFFLFVLSLAFGGVPYIFFAAGLFFLMRRISSVATIRWLTLLVLPVFVPVHAILMFGLSSVAEYGGFGSLEVWDYLPAFATYILLVGYGYVLVVNAGYFGARKLGWIKESGDLAPSKGYPPK